MSTQHASVRLVFDQLVASEPRLGALRGIAEEAGRRQRRRDGGFYANAVWNGFGRPIGELALRAEVVELVGSWSQHPDPIMHTNDAYEIAYQTLCDLLPPCDHDDLACG